MAAPNILLREFHTDTISDWIPGKLVDTYEQLEILAYGVCEKDPKRWSVHFHFEDGKCERKALQFLWNSAAYFDQSCLVAGKLYVFAHFEQKGIPRIRHGTQSTAPSTADNTEASFNAQSTPQNMLDEAGMPVASRPRRILQSRSRLEPVRKRQKVVDLSSSRSEFGEFNFLMSGSDTDEDESSELNIQPTLSFPPLPRNATSEQHALDLEACSTSNAPYGHYGYKHNWDQIGLNYRAKVAHARLIHGIYGTESPSACDRCAEKGLKCRKYHPDVMRAQGSCGECRLISSTCAINDQSQRVNSRDDEEMRKKRKSLPQSLPTRSTSRQSLDVRQTRSMAHQDSDEKFTSRASGKYLCPIPDCRSHTIAITRNDNLRNHVRHFHPKSIHALVLEAIRGRGLPLILPPALSVKQHSQDMVACEVTNAPVGVYGHRSEDVWENFPHSERTRMAHARLINGEYGVIAPEGCKGCKMRRTTCMVYHPSLVDASGRALGSYCGECRNRNVVCDIPPRPFDKLLAVQSQQTMNGGEIPHMDSPANDEAEDSPTLNKHHGIQVHTTRAPDGRDVEPKFVDDDALVGTTRAYVGFSQVPMTTVALTPVVTAHELEFSPSGRPLHTQVSRLRTRTRVLPPSTANRVSASSNPELEQPNHRLRTSNKLLGLEPKPFKNSLPDPNHAPDAEEERFGFAEETPNTASASHPSLYGKGGYQSF